MAVKKAPVSEVAASVVASEAPASSVDVDMVALVSYDSEGNPAQSDGFIHIED